MRPLLDVLFPPLCHICRSFLPEAGELHICDPCRSDMPPVTHPCCSLCGMPFAGAGEDHVCGSCCKSPPAFDTARAALSYEGACRELIHNFKYNSKTHLRRPLALLTASLLDDFAPARSADLLIPVPLHRRRLRKRGFNQALLMGEIVAEKWQIPVERDALQRIRWTDPQVTLSSAERRSNVRGAFAVRDASLVRGRRVLLLDDVFTTGSTVDECAGMLKGAGALSVTVVTAAFAKLA